VPNATQYAQVCAARGSMDEITYRHNYQINTRMERLTANWC